MYSFLYPFYLLLIIPVGIFVFYLYKKGGKNIVFGDIKILKDVFKNNSIYYKLYYLIIVFIFISFICVFSNLIQREDKVNSNEKGIDIVLAIDVSESMLATDLYPNRLEVSKNIIKKFINKLESDRLGLILFAGKAFTSLPLNFEYDFSSTIIGNINTNIIDSRLGGTAIGDAIVIASEVFDDKSIDREQIIILLTDGDVNTGIDPIKAVDLLKTEDKNIKIYTIGLGGAQDAYIETYNIFGDKIKQQVGKLNEDLLKQISQKSGGKYFRASDEKTLESIFEEISLLEKREIMHEKYTINHDKNIYIVYLLIGLFIILFICKYKKD